VFLDFNILSLLPIIISAFLGSISQDYFASIKKHRKLSERFFGIIVSAVVSIMTVGFGGSIIGLEKIVDWKAIAFISFIFGYVGTKIGQLLANTSLGLRLIGQDKTADALDWAQIEEDFKKKENDLKKKDIKKRLDDTDKIVPRQLEDFIEASGNDPGIDMKKIIEEKKQLRKLL
jgi:hypothetical protein